MLPNFCFKYRIIKYGNFGFLNGSLSKTLHDRNHNQYDAWFQAKSQKHSNNVSKHTNGGKVSFGATSIVLQEGDADVEWD